MKIAESAPAPTDRARQSSGGIHHQTEAPGDWVTRLRDPRSFASRPDAVDRVHQRVTGLEQLLQSAQGQPDEVGLRRRLAEAQVELRYAVARHGLPWAIGGQRTPANLDDLASQGAIAQYQAIVGQFPRYAKVDEVLYFLAFEHEHQGDLPSARTAYLKLIQDTPRSDLVPAAYVALAEHFMAQAGSEPTHWALAQAAYEAALKYPPPKNRLACLARYRLVGLFEMAGAAVKAEEARLAALQCVERHDLPGRNRIRAALR